jgi:polyprenyl P-hydroxybenzoate/phenylacrylic acid decarboxylase-like protein
VSGDRLIVAISGSTGTIYGVRLLTVLSERFADIETHLVLTRAARVTMAEELGGDPADVERLGSVVHDERNLGAAIASGTFLTRGMIVCPCSIKTLSGIATSYSDSLVTRAADVCLKERRRLVLVVRETPLHLNHLRLMIQATEAGAVIAPPSPAFYHRPQTLEDVVDHTVVKILDLLGLNVDGLISRWEGLTLG